MTPNSTCRYQGRIKRRRRRCKRRCGSSEANGSSWRRGFGVEQLLRLAAIRSLTGRPRGEQSVAQVMARLLPDTVWVTTTPRLSATAAQIRDRRNRRSVP